MPKPVASVRRAAVVALVGNPNSGKTSVFNALTGSRQKVGNYAGVTVEKVTGRFEADGVPIDLLDVPGMYSMRPVSTDETVAADVIADDDKIEALVCVVDASNLERNLFFFSQLLGAGQPTVVALTMTDVLAQEGAEINVGRLSEILGVEVVPVVSHKGKGLAELRSAVVRSLEAQRRPDVDLGFPNVVREPVFRLHERLAMAGIDATKSQVREALLDENAALNRRLANLPEFVEAFVEARREALGASGDGRTLDAQTRYAWAGRVTREVLITSVQATRRVSDRIDAVLTHRIFGPLVFFALMYLVFQSIYTLAKPLMDLIEAGTSAVSSAVSPALAFNPILQSLVVDGVLTGIGAALVFLPQICILFFFIALLEGTGYLARAAFLMDRMLGWAGLNGRAFIPLLSSFACAVPGIMGARVMPDERSRLATVLVAPLMSCSARLPVYVLMIGAFVEPKFGPIAAGLTLFGMHFLGLLIAVPTVWVLNRFAFRARRIPFVLELPRYQWPRGRDVLLTVSSRAKVFLTTAGTVILALSVVIWALTYFPRSAEAEARYEAEYANESASFRSEVLVENYVAQHQIRDSYLGQFGRFVEPVFRPAGFDWRLTTAVLAAFPAREVVVSAMGIIFDLGGEVDETSRSLPEALSKATWPDGRPLLTLPTAIALMVFFALCAQCMATLAAIRRETNSWKWAAFSFGYMTVLAYVFAVLVYQVGTRITG
ncbi:MAG: ferrous iron transport protein B [Fimbriimonadaceae bacterium]|nr:ferrous iron transport protein B [Fimbriimonadaceae bacterium]QYK55051.1 MAG: ferrous iron transport protein B [Fimbriimonadaceae bacterium]